MRSPLAGYIRYDSEPIRKLNSNNSHGRLKTLLVCLRMETGTVQQSPAQLELKLKAPTQQRPPGGGEGTGGGK